jgi:3-oxoacyl-[acyl-carrier-protein] synthase II
MKYPQNRRVVITGLGMVTPAGLTAESTWKSLLAGESAVGPITKFDASEFACKIAAEVKGFDPLVAMDAKDVKRTDIFIQYGMVATAEAMADAGLTELTEEQKLRAGVILGSGIGGFNEIESTVLTLNERGPRRVSPFFIPSMLINLLSGQASIKYGLKGPNLSVVTACATGAHAVGDAMHIIKRGEADIMVAGGAEAGITKSAVAGFGSARALSTKFNDTPEKASRPYDEDRDGFVIAEGAGVLVLEEYEHAKARGATIYAEVAGFGQTGDAYHLTSPAEDGDGAKRAMSLALEFAGLKGSDVDYTNSHGTSTPMGDGIESRAIESVLGSDAVVSSTKSMIGHTLGAAGGIETAICLLAMRDGMAPPTINLENPSEDCNLDYVTEGARKMNIDVVMNNSFGFGGTNASLVLTKVKD